MILLLYLLVLVTRKALAAPATSSQSQMPFDSTQNAADTGLFTQYNDPLSAVPITSPPSVASTSLSNPTDTTSSPLTQSNDPSSTVPVTSPLSPISSSLSPSSASSTLPPTSVIIVPEVATIFETTTVDATPSSTTIVTVVLTEAATATVTTTPSPSWDNRTVWAASPQMTDLSAFNVTDFPSGQKNLYIVSQIPTQAIAPTAKFRQSPPNTNPPSTILQLVYPAHSINPGNKPEGGADFYATPLNLAGARNVTLEYSVFFPADFDWVKGGKLPGLFGGHMGCSGGASARDCFSTRLMWRPQGVGELYLYAPKDKQTQALCGDVSSVCDATYGLSIGRGTFNFAAGDWTYLRQSVVLNTPGQSDGTFTLFVDERPVINRKDIFFRDVTQQSKKNKSTLKMSMAFTPITTVPQHVTAITLDGNEGVPQPAEFIGLFFSTFFGGHGKQYATPKEQHTWFKDFVITRHD